MGNEPTRADVAFLASRRARTLLLSTAVASLAAGLLAPGVAQAADECGAAQQGVVTCTPAGNPFVNGIEYATPAVDPSQDPGLDLGVPVYDLTINLDRGVAIQRADGAGVALIGFNEGGVTLNSAPDTSIAVTGTGSIGILASTNAGDITINTQSLTASGRASGGINANASSGDITINAGSVAVTGNGTLGISANSYAGDVTINAGTVDATGYYTGGINAYVGSGTLSVAVDRVTTSGGSFYNYGSNAIDLTAVGGTITVDAGDVSTGADYSNGVQAVSFGTHGAVDVTVDSVATSGYASFGAQIQGATAALNAGAIATTGDYGYGAILFGTGAGGATLNADTITTTGDNATGAIVRGYADGAANVSVGTVVTTGADATGISAAALGSGDVTLNVDTVTVTGVRSNAVIATSYQGNVAVNVENASTIGDETFAVAALSRAGGDVSVISNSSIVTTGDYSPGVYAVAGPGGNASVTVNNVSTDGFLSRAVDARGDSVDVTINGSVRTNDFGSPAIYAAAANGVATVTNNGAIETAVGGGNGIVALGSDGVTISGTGTIVTNGPSATGIYASSLNGATTVTATSVVTAGTYSRGVIAQGTGDVTLDLGDVITGGAIGTAIEAATFQNGSGPLDADLIVAVDAVTVNGDFSHGINVFSSNNGVLNIDAGTVTVNGATGIGILSQSYTADTTINVGSVVTTGSGDAYSSPTAIRATSDTGNIGITSSNLVATEGLGGTGVFAATAGDVTIDVNDVSTRGDNAPAIVGAGGNTAVTIHGDVSTAGANAPGVYAVGQTGTSTATNNGTVTTTGAGSGGILALASGDVTVSGTGAVQSSGTGVDLYSYAGNIVAGQAAIVTTGDGADGIRAETANAAGTAGNITIDTGTITTSGNAADGIDAAAPGGGAIAITHGAIATSGDESFGVVAVGLDTVTVSGGSVTTTGYNAAGVYAVSILGDASVANTGTISTTGEYAPGAVAASYFGNAAIDVNAISTTGYSSDGAFAVAFYGDAAASVNTVSTAGDNSIGVRVQAYNDAIATVAGSATTSGAYADAVNVLTQYGTAAVINNGTILTSGVEANGIDASSGNGGIVISGTGSVTTRGDFSTAIAARTTSGPVSISTGTVATSGAGAGGINAYGGGGVTIDADAVTTTGREAFGIAAGGSYSVTVTADQVRTSGDRANGIDAASFGGDVIVDVGSVRSSGADSIAIRAFGFGGGTDVRATGAVVSNTGVAVRMRAGGVGGGGNIGLGDPALDGIARLVIASGGSVVGGTDAVWIDAVRGAVIDNAGTISGGSGYALRVSGAPATITNSGAINGRLLLTDGNDTLTNSGRWTLSGVSDFGAGTDTLTSSGLIRLATARAAQVASVTGLETFANSGLLDLRNDIVGDRLTFANTAYTGSGDAMLGLDVAFGTGTAAADQIILGSAAGTTTISLNAMGTPTLFAPVTLVDVAAASSPDAFTLPGGSTEIGLIALGVAYAPEATAYQLVSAPGSAVYRQAQLGEALTTLWNRSADAVSARFSSSRDAAWAGETATGSGRLWLQSLGEMNTRKDRRDLNYAGVSQPDVNLGYRQDAFGTQVGFDLVDGSSQGGAIAGLTAGYLNSTTRFLAGGSDRFEVDAFNIGLYAGFHGGPFFVNGLAKYDFYKVDRRSYLAGLDRNDDAHAWGGKVEAGVLLGSARFFAEPLVSLAYSRTSLDDFQVGPNAFDYDRFDGLRGKAGLRLGGHTDVAGSTVAFYAAGAAVKEFEGRNGLRFASGGQTVELRSERLNSFGQGTLGMNVTMAGGVSGFLEGHGEFGKEYRGGGGRVGLRVRF
ncbi:hypothetical protein [Sphingomonas desiccabilis]|uniref:hypothetical protein n=3 Tax=Sphingomonas desiccabilis TaxID=429134 RepID=UPI0013ED7BC8|nr:hypothetical protein [Sphingomonas desiccabilis]MBB3912586.1 hypothetical protein [Sphingomonas desiccabilis]